MYENVLYIFRRDLRIVDNKTLNMLSSISKNIYTIFIMTPEQLGFTNKYKSNNCVQFMMESLIDLEREIEQKGGKLQCFYGTNAKVITDCIDAFNIDAVGFNVDYTPYAKERDREISELCETRNIKCITEHDYYLHTPGSVLNGTGGPYQKFTPYFNKVNKIPIGSPEHVKKIPFSNKNVKMNYTISLSDAIKRFVKINPDISVHGGRTEGLQALKKAVVSQAHYSQTRDDLTKETSHLSAYIKFGCVSIREVAHLFRNNDSLYRQLIWRDFYANIMHHFPHVIGHALKPNYDKIKWSNNEEYFNAWRKGTTGVPLVDACMRQLNTIGWMHNRGRMVVSNFLTKVLLIDWRKGEKYFATQLVDYDPANNNGGWQWSSGSGADSQPYFRIFNPYTQSKDHDPECKYIKKWIPELESVPIKDIHQWDKTFIQYTHIKYNGPIIVYKDQVQKALSMYNTVFS